MIIPVIISLVVIVAFGFALVKLWQLSKKRSDFFSKAKDFGLKGGEARELKKLSDRCGIEEPLLLFQSQGAVDRCIETFIEDSKQRGTSSSSQDEMFLEKLYAFKTKVVLKRDESQKIKSTVSLAIGQRVSVILKGKGVFKSRILSSGDNLVIMLPYQMMKNVKMPTFLPESEWLNKEISVYFWRAQDAAYAFDTKVLSSGIFRGEKALYIMHSNKLDRTQKRKSVRSQSDIPAYMFMIGKNEKIDYDKVDTENGFKCLIEDLSEDGALIRIGGKAQKDAAMKLQFKVNGILIVMHGVIRAVEWNEKMNHSRVHFDCTHIDRSMKNTVLAYVYKLLPEDERTINQAIEDARAEN